VECSKANTTEFAELLHYKILLQLLLSVNCDIAKCTQSVFLGQPLNCTLKVGPLLWLSSSVYLSQMYCG